MCLGRPPTYARAVPRAVTQSAAPTSPGTASIPWFRRQRRSFSASDVAAIIAPHTMRNAACSATVLLQRGVRFKLNFCTSDTCSNTLMRLDEFRELLNTPASSPLCATSGDNRGDSFVLTGPPAGDDHSRSIYAERCLLEFRKLSDSSWISDSFPLLPESKPVSDRYLNAIRYEFDIR
jgi:hypothetical protein